MNRYEIKRRLVEGLRMAAEAGDKAIGYVPGENGGRPSFSMDDGGTCNMDTPMFVLPRVPVALVEEAGREAGVGIFDTEHLGKRCFCIVLNWKGQANRRAKQMQAALSSLRWNKELNEIPGFRAWGWYAMD